MEDEYEATLSAGMLYTWVNVSQLLWWLVLIFALLSQPILCHAFVTMLRHRNSNYFYFLTSMIVADLTMLSAICINLVSDYFFPKLKGSAMCKLTAFATNSTACFVNWVWVIMFVQRLTFVVFPMERVKPSGTFFQLICNTKRALAITAFMATTTQAWSPILMTEITIRDNEGEVEASFCGADSTLVYEQLFKWIAVAESMWTYAIPFFVTVISDMAVIVLHHSSTKFTLVSREDMRNFPLYVTSSSGTQRNNCASSDCVALKIQSTESIKTCTVRRQRAIRRCLLMATIQLLLNLPNYVLQLVDEFACLRNSETSSVFYVYADAVFYILYLLQFPMLAIYVHLLHQDVHLIRGNELPNRKLLLHTIDRQLNGSRRRSRGASGSGRLTCIR